MEPAEETDQTAVCGKHGAVLVPKTSLATHQSELANMTAQIGSADVSTATHLSE